MPFAKIYQDAFERMHELTCEEWRLFTLILFHTWDDTGLCNKTIPEICEIWGLDYHNTYRRYKILRKDFQPFELERLDEKLRRRLAKMATPWCEETPDGIRPLVGVKGVKITPKSEKDGVKITPKNNGIGVKITPPRCKNYTNGRKNGVKITPRFKGITEPLNTEPTEPLKTAATAEENAAAETNGHLSKFSLEECIRYVEISRAKGEKIKNPQGLAMSAYQSGKLDAFIQAALYPETPELKYEYDSDSKKPLSAKEREEQLAMLRADIAAGLDISSFEQHFIEEDWRWLMENLSK